MMHLAGTISEHPVVAHAVGECVGDLLERRGDSPDLLVLCISERLRGATEDIAAAVRTLLGPEVLLGISSTTMSVGPRSSGGNPALAMLAVWHAQPTGRPGQVVIEPDWQVRSSDRVTGVRFSPDLDVAQVAGSSGTLVLFADPFSAPLATLVERIGEVAPELFVMAASLDSARRPSMSGLVLDDQIYSDGAVGVLLPEGFPHRLLFSFGFTPIGAKFAVGRFDASRILELGGEAAKDVLGRAIEGLAPAERAAATKGLYLRWTDSSGPGTNVPRFSSVLGTDGDSIVVAGEPPGDTALVQFHVRDGESVDADLHRLAAANSDLLGGLFLVADRPERSALPGYIADLPAVPGIHLPVADQISEDAVILDEEISGSELLGIRCGEVILMDRGDVVAASRAISILGLVG